MVLLNLFRSILSISRSTFFTVLLTGTSVLNADVLSYFNPSYSQAKIYTSSFNTVIANDPVSLESFFNDWQGDFHPHSGANLALESSRFDLGVVLEDNYYIGYTYRHDVFIEASSDLTRLMYLTKNKLDLPLNEKFDIFLDIEGLEAQGIVFGKKFIFTPTKWGEWSFSLIGSLLYASNTQNGILSGDAKSISKNDYDFQADSYYYYTHNYLYDLDVQKVNGFGFSTHITVDYKYKDFSITLIANDILGKIYWDSLPYSYISMNSENKYYDENGYVHYNPTIHGIEKTKDYTQRLPIKLHFEGRYKVKEKYLLSMGFESMNNYIFPFSKFTYIPEKNKSYFISHEYRFDSTTIGMNYKNIDISLSADKIIDPSIVGVHLLASFHF